MNLTDLCLYAWPFFMTELPLGQRWTRLEYNEQPIGQSCRHNPTSLLLCRIVYICRALYLSPYSLPCRRTGARSISSGCVTPCPCGHPRAAARPRPMSCYSCHQLASNVGVGRYSKFLVQHVSQFTNLGMFRLPCPVPRSEVWYCTPALYGAIPCTVLTNVPHLPCPRAHFLK